MNIYQPTFTIPAAMLFAAALGIITQYKYKIIPQKKVDKQ